MGHPWPAVKVSIFPQLQHPTSSYLASRMGGGKIGADRRFLSALVRLPICGRRSKIVVAPAYAFIRPGGDKQQFVARDPNLENVHTAQEPTP